MTGALATTPITWGYVGGNRWGIDMPPRTILGEMRDLGFTASEAGVPGFLPDDIGEAKALLEEFGIEAIAGPVSFVAHEAGSLPDATTRVEAAASRLAQLGATVLITVPKPGAHQLGEPLPPEQFTRLVASLHEIEAVAAAYGLRQALHPHVGSLVETADDMAQLLEAADIGWCLDTAHLASGDMSTEVFVEIAGDRITHVHVKDLDIALGQKMVAHEIGFDEAISANVFRALGDGDLDLGPVLAVLPRDVWWVLEQDVAVPAAPEQGEGPIRDARRSLEEIRRRLANVVQ
ncbi:MAG: sugar phosphate isomerase/epimerase family protein [Acidimicrobiales bacterium]